MATKEDMRKLERKFESRIDKLEDDFRREHKRLRDRISDLEHNYEGIAIGAKVGQRQKLTMGPFFTFVEDSPFCTEYRIATYREKTGLL